MVLTIWIGILGSLTAGLACYGSHRHAKKHRWGYVPRYVAGVAFALVAFAFVVFSLPVPIETGAILMGLLALIFGGEGVATWFAHQNEPDPPAHSLTPEADKLLREIDEELGR